MRSKDLEIVRGLPLLSGLPSALVDRLTAGAMVQALPRGSVLCVQGEIPEFLHFILDGRVALAGAKTSGEETIVEFFDSGDVLIAPAVMLDAPYLLSARVVDDAHILFVDAATVRSCLQQDRQFAHAMALLLAGYWRRFVQQIMGLKLHSSTERLADYLAGLATQPSGPASVKLPEDRRMIAARLGMTAASLSRAFASLRALGVGGSGRTVTMLDIGRLRDYGRPKD